MKDDTRLQLVDAHAGELGEATILDLPRLLAPGDVLVVNDAATFPASLWVSTEAREPLELRLLDAPYGTLTRAVAFGAGDFRTKTELRAPPPLLCAGDVLHQGDDQWLVADVCSRHPRLVTLAWPGSLAQRFHTLYERGRPVQYSYVPEPLALWDVQTVFASRPFASEMPSAARPITRETWRVLEQRGVRVAPLSHAAGLSSTGDGALDAALPLPESYEIPRSTAELVRAARSEGRRVVALGTSVVRALEDSAHRHGVVRAGAAQATLVLGPNTVRRVVSGLVTGIHVAGESHYRLLEAFVPGALLARAATMANERGYRLHEFGDACLILDGVLGGAARTQTAFLTFQGGSTS